MKVDVLEALGGHETQSRHMKGMEEWKSVPGVPVNLMESLTNLECPSSSFSREQELYFHLIEAIVWGLFTIISDKLEKNVQPRTGLISLLRKNSYKLVLKKGRNKQTNH